MKKIYISIGIVLMLVLSTFTASAATIDNDKNIIDVNSNGGLITDYLGGVTIDLIADGGSPDTAFKVGEIYLWHDAVPGTLHIEYTITKEDWEMTLTHVHMGNGLDEFPLTKKGLPQVGRFEYFTPYDPPITYPNTVEETYFYNGESKIAVHGEVQTICGYEDPVYDPIYFEASLPDQVTFKVTYPYGGGPAYFPHTYINGLLGGQIDIYSWCVDTDHTIGQNTWYTANIYSSYEALSAGLVEYPENLDLVNWILNYGYIGQTSPGCGGTYTYGDVQKAIWTLVEDNPSAAGLGSWSQCRVNEILAAAYANGEGFIPECGDFIGIILAPVNNQQVLIAQAILGTIYAPCYEEPIYCDETFWAEGFEFTNMKSWAMYFYYPEAPNIKSFDRGKLLEFIWEKLATILENLGKT